jgi:hypothetical protein
MAPSKKFGVSLAGKVSKTVRTLAGEHGAMGRGDRPGIQMSVNALRQAAIRFARLRGLSSMNIMLWPNRNA